MVAGQRKPETQWIPEERKAANLDQRLKSLIMSMLPDDQMNSVINCLTAKSTWDDLILYHEGPFDMKESRDSQDSPDDEEDTRSSQEYMNDLEEEYQARDLLTKSKRITTARRVSTVKRIKTREMFKMKIVYQDYLRDKNLQEELFTHKEELDLETAQTTTTAKLPILKQVAQTTTNADDTSTSLIHGHVTTEEKDQNNNDVKARNLVKIVSQLAILGENISQEDLNLKFLRSLPSEWNTQVVVWRNKPDLDTMSFDDLYNNFKIVKQK
ncbi:hypothetical protein Tco_1284901, partial [Tanacetum coccineum]